MLRKRDAFLNPSVTVAYGCILAALLLFAFNTRAFVNAARPLQEFQLQAESPRFWNLVDHHAQLGVVAKGFGFAEGPVWDPQGFL